jgi:hypothetical protein
MFSLSLLPPTSNVCLKYEVCIYVSWWINTNDAIDIHPHLVNPRQVEVDDLWKLPSYSNPWNREERINPSYDRSNFTIGNRLSLPEGTREQLESGYRVSERLSGFSTKEGKVSAGELPLWELSNLLTSVLAQEPGPIWFGEKNENGQYMWVLYLLFFVIFFLSFFPSSRRELLLSECFPAI